MGVRRFDGLALLRMWSGKKVMFVGDSLALNQYESLLCMIHAAAPGARATVSPRSGKIDPSTSVRFEVRNTYVRADASSSVCCFVFKLKIVLFGKKSWRRLGLGWVGAHDEVIRRSGMDARQQVATRESGMIGWWIYGS